MLAIERRKRLVVPSRDPAQPIGIIRLQSQHHPYRCARGPPCDKAR
jgi:hypothetical protein